MKVKYDFSQYLRCIEPQYKTKGKVVYLLLTTPYKTNYGDCREYKA